MSNRYIATARMTCDTPLADEVQDKFKIHRSLWNFRQVEDDGAGRPRYACGVQFLMPENLAQLAAHADLLPPNEQHNLTMEMKTEARRIVELCLRRIAATLGVNPIEVEIGDPILDSEDEPNPWEELEESGSA